MELSRRLLSVAGEVSRGNRLADIGTDHGYIPIYLVQQGIVPWAVAMDVNRGPLERAIANIKEAGLEAVIGTRLSDGLARLEPEEVDTIVIAGMGGALMEDILTRGLSILTAGKELILQPQSEIFKVRHFLHHHGYRIVKETILKEDGKYYFIIKASPGEQHFSEEYLYEYGEYLLMTKDPLMKEYLRMETDKYRAILDSLKDNASEAARVRKEQMKDCILKLEKTYQYEK